LEYRSKKTLEEKIVKITNKRKNKYFFYYFFLS